MTERWIGWHFLPENGKLAHNPRRNGGKPVETGVPLPQYKSKPIACERGYHASLRAIDALQYAPGPLVSRVELTGEVVEQHDKTCAQGRTHISPIIDVSRELRLFAAWCARQALMAERKAGREPDPRSWQAVRVAVRYAAGLATADELSAARSAAWSAARSAAWSAAAESAAYSAAYSAQNDHLTTMLFKRLEQEGYRED